MALPEWFHELAGRVRNWGRWGVLDEIGTVNLIDDVARRRGAASVRSGRAFSLAMSLQQDLLNTADEGPTTRLHMMTAVNASLTGDLREFSTSDDTLHIGMHDWTHWDALAHVSYDGLLYNGFPAFSVTGDGAARCAIHKIPSLVSRGVLLDIARLKGVDCLEGSYAITADDLDAAADLANVRVEPGDVVLIRTGKMRALLQQPPDRLGYMFPNPGPSLNTVEWFRRHDVAAVANDTLTFEVYPSERAGVQLPVHLLHLVDMGLTQGQNFVLDALGDDCADDGQYTFLLDASPLPVVGGTGSIVNPVAIK